MKHAAIICAGILLLTAGAAAQQGDSKDDDHARHGDAAHMARARVRNGDAPRWVDVDLRDGGKNGDRPAGDARELGICVPMVEGQIPFRIS